MPEPQKGPVQDQARAVKGADRVDNRGERVEIRENFPVATPTPVPPGRGVPSVESGRRVFQSGERVEVRESFTVATPTLAPLPLGLRVPMQARHAMGPSNLPDIGVMPYPGTTGPLQPGVAGIGSNVPTGRAAASRVLQRSDIDAAAKTRRLPPLQSLRAFIAQSMTDETGLVTADTLIAIALGSHFDGGFATYDNIRKLFDSTKAARDDIHGEIGSKSVVAAIAGDHVLKFYSLYLEALLEATELMSVPDAEVAKVAALSKEITDALATLEFDGKTLHGMHPGAPAKAGEWIDKYVGAHGGLLAAPTKVVGSPYGPIHCWFLPHAGTGRMSILFNLVDLECGLIN